MYANISLSKRESRSLVFEDGGVPKHKQNKNIPDANNKE